MSAVTKENARLLGAEMIRRGGTSEKVRVLTGLLPFKAATVRGIVQKFGELLDEDFGIYNIRYRIAEYTPSGAGAFGRLGGGRRGQYREATLSWKLRNS